MNFLLVTQLFSAEPSLVVYSYSDRAFLDLDIKAMTTKLRGQIVRPKTLSFEVRNRRW